MNAIYGMLICQDGIADIARCIESVVPVVDEYIVMDGGSTDGTREWLHKYKDVYNLTLLEHEYDEQGAQRNRVLSKIPKNVWVVDLDQDEELNYHATHGLRSVIESVPRTSYDTTLRHLPLALNIRVINLIHDIFHYNKKSPSLFGTKVFFNDQNLHFTPGYHTTISYFTEDTHANYYPCPDNFIIKHYAYLNTSRITNYTSDSLRSYTASEWDSSQWESEEIPEQWL